MNNQTNEASRLSGEEIGASPAIRGIRFLRDLKFPRFSMKAGETWEHGFPPAHHGLGRTARGYFNALACGADRFEFAGGYCYVNDVEALS